MRIREQARLMLLSNNCSMSLHEPPCLQVCTHVGIDAKTQTDRKDVSANKCFKRRNDTGRIPKCDVQRASHQAELPRRRLSLLRLTPDSLSRLTKTHEIHLAIRANPSCFRFRWGSLSLPGSIRIFLACVTTTLRENGFVQIEGPDHEALMILERGVHLCML